MYHKLKRGLFLTQTHMSSNTFTDERGTITDLFQSEGFSITHITFKKGAVRGNHYHKNTHQYDRIITGKFVIASNEGSLILEAGNEVNFPPNTSHAYLALTDGEIISTCVGTRVGTDYEKDTFRLEKPLL